MLILILILLIVFLNEKKMRCSEKFSDKILNKNDILDFKRIDYNCLRNRYEKKDKTDVKDEKKVWCSTFKYINKFNDVKFKDKYFTEDLPNPNNKSKLGSICVNDEDCIQGWPCGITSCVEKIDKNKKKYKTCEIRGHRDILNDGRILNKKTYDDFVKKVHSYKKKNIIIKKKV